MVGPTYKNIEEYGKLIVLSELLSKSFLIPMIGKGGA